MCKLRARCPWYWIHQSIREDIMKVHNQKLCKSRGFPGILTGQLILLSQVGRGLS